MSFTHEFPNGLQFGDCVEINGVVAAGRFLLRLISNCPVLSNEADELPLMNPIPLDISLDTDGAWEIYGESAQASSSSSGFSCKRHGFIMGKPFTCRVYIKSDNFEVYLNDYRLSISEHLVPVGFIQTLIISGASELRVFLFGESKAVEYVSKVLKENHELTNKAALIENPWVYECSLALHDQEIHTVNHNDIDSQNPLNDPITLLRADDGTNGYASDARPKLEELDLNIYETRAQLLMEKEQNGDRFKIVDKTVDRLKTQDGLRIRPKLKNHLSVDAIQSGKLMAEFESQCIYDRHLSMDPNTIRNNYPEDPAEYEDDYSFSANMIVQSQEEQEEFSIFTDRILRSETEQCMPERTESAISSDDGILPEYDVKVEDIEDEMNPPIRPKELPSLPIMLDHRSLSFVDQLRGQSVDEPETPQIGKQGITAPEFSKNIGSESHNFGGTCE